MDVEQAAQRYASLSVEAQVRVLARFGHNLTIAARDTYEFQSPRVLAPERLRAINEIQHRVLSHLQALLMRCESRYPDDVLLRILLEPDDEYLRAQTGWAFGDALSPPEGTTRGT